MEEYKKFKIGDIVRIFRNEEDDRYPIGDLLTLIREDKSCCPLFKHLETSKEIYFYNHYLELANSEPIYNIF